ncbi:MAG: Holliday junction branch migration protein RuvA [Flavobacteriales bacterium]|nr:Holliday junction branch migration protein RuvA [Flavobacteriales bacterium]
MYEFVKGRMTEKNPAYVVIDCNGLGYFLHISLNTYTQLGNEENVLLFTHQVIREDAHILFGFKSKEERSVFRSLLNVSGVGASTARMVLSSMTPDEVQTAIGTGNVSAFQKIKGIGGKTAQRIIVDLSGKLEKLDLSAGNQGSAVRQEALSALVTLGFDKSTAEKGIDKVLASQNNLAVEELIKLALKNM